MRYISTILLFIISLNSFCQWEQTSGPITSIEIYDIALKDSTLFTSTPCGSFISENSGSSWRPINFVPFYASAIFHDTLYLGGQDVIQKAFRVNNEWQFKYDDLNSSFLTLDKVTDLYSDDSLLYCSSLLSGFLYTDDGKNWKSFNNELPKDARLHHPNITYYTYDSYAVDGNTDYIFIGTKNGIYRSQKINLNWIPKNNNLISSKIDAILCKDSVVFMSTKNKIYKSNDNGENWLLSDSILPENRIKKLELIKDTIFAISDNQGLLTSANLGVTWEFINPGLNNINLNCIINFNNTYFLGCEDGVYKNLSSSEKTSRNIVCSRIVDLEKNDSCIAAVNFLNVFLSSDNGTTWTNSTDSIPFRWMVSITNVNNKLFFSGEVFPYEFSNNYIEDGINPFWAKTTYLKSYGDPYGVRSNGQMMIAFSDDKLFITENNGLIWTDISPPSGVFVCNNFNDVLFVNNEIYIANCGYGDLAKTSNYGLTWQVINNGINTEILSLRECNGIIFAASYSHLYKSIDLGLTWQICDKDLPMTIYPGNYYIQDFASNNRYCFLCYNNKVFASNDMGNSWSNISLGLPDLPDYEGGGSLLIKDNLLFFGTNNFGVWNRNINDIVLGSSSKKFTDDIKVYPNPAENIVYFQTLGRDNIKQIDIFDYTGVLIKSSLINGNKLNIGDIPKGIYLLKIYADNNNLRFAKIIKTN